MDEVDTENVKVEKGEIENLGPADRQLTYTGKMKIFDAMKEYFDAKINYYQGPGEEATTRLQKAETNLKDIILHLRWTIDETEANRR